MKKVLYFALVALLLQSCGSNQDSGNKQQELDSLLAAQSEINERIRVLRDEIQSGDSTGNSAVLVTTASLQPETFKHYVEVQARVDGDESVPVSPRSQGIVTAIMVREGDHVNAGQVLATLDDQLVRQSLAEVQTQYDFAKSVYVKQKNLWDQKIGSEMQYLTAKNNMESLEKRLATVSEQLDMTRLKAPVSGTVDNVSIKIGQAVAPGVPAISVVNLSKLKVKGEVGESYAGKIKKGDDVILGFPDLNLEVPGKVGYASKAINALNRTFNVEVPLSSSTPGVSPNMIVVMKIIDYTSEKAFVVPVDLLQRSGEGYYLMTATSNGNKLVAHRQAVEVGLISNGKAEITSGIKPEDQVIMVGYRDLVEGQEIRTK